MRNHRPTLGVLLIAFSSASFASSLSELTSMDEVLAQRQRSELSAAIDDAAVRAQHRAIYLHSTLKVAPRAIQAFLYRGKDRDSLATLQFEPIPDSAMWRAELPVLESGSYRAKVQLSVDAGSTELMQKLPLDANTGLVEWRLEDRLVGGVAIDSTHWLIEPPGWWSSAVDWVVPDGARQRVLARQPRHRPDYRAAKERCAVAHLDGLASMLYSVRETPFDSDLVEDFLDCALALDLRFVVHQILQSWPDGALSDRSWAMVLQAMRRDIAHGHADRALQVLTRRAPTRQTALQEAQWRDLVSRVLLDRGQQAQARTYLREGPHMSADQTLVGDADLQLLFQAMRLNLAISLLRDEHSDEALNLLDQIGRVTPTSKAVAALRDRANVLLGWQFLKREQGLTAQAIFNRVDLHGDAAAAALLGRGYALVAPPGERQVREERDETSDARLQAETASTLAAKYRGGFISCEQYQKALADDTVCARSRAFDQVGRDYSDAEKTQRAVQSWLLVADRDGVDLATQEARLRAATALIAAGRNAPALNMLERALQVFQQQDQAPQHERHWLREEILKTPLTADQAVQRLDQVQGQSVAAADALARWLAQEQIRAMFDLRAKAYRLGLLEIVDQSNEILLASLNQSDQRRNQEQAQMESEIRLHLAKLYHRGALGG